MTVFVQSRAPEADLKTLVDVRDGTVHAAQSEELEERLVVAFVLQADAFLADLGRDRAEFWGGQRGVVDALVTEAADRTVRDVAVRIAGARADFGRRYSDGPAEVLQLLRQIAASAKLDSEERRQECPACETPRRGLGRPRGRLGLRTRCAGSPPRDAQQGLVQRLRFRVQDLRLAP